MTYTEILKKKQNKQNGSLNSGFQNLLEKVQAAQSVSSPSGVKPTRDTVNVTLPTFSKALKFKAPESAIGNPNTVTPGIMENNPTLPNINADSLAIGGVASEVKGNQITTGDPNNPTYTDIRNNSGAVSAGVSGKGEAVTPTVTGESKVEKETGAIVAESKPMTFEEWYNATKRRATETYEKSVADAELERRRAVLDAGNAYDHNRSAYGDNAAALGAMGLTGSGYSQYLDSKAYADMRGDINAADRTKQISVDNAEAVRSNTEAQADNLYMDYLNRREESRTNMFNALYDNVGNLSNAAIDTLAAANGLTPEQVTFLKMGRREKVSAALDAAISGGEWYKKSDLDRLFDQSIPDEKALYDKYFAKLADTNGVIDENSFFDDGVLKDASKIKDIIANAKESGVPDADIKKLEEMYNKFYTVGNTAGGGGTVRYTGTGLKPEKEGDNFKVEWTDSTGKKLIFKVENGGKVSDRDNVHSVSMGISDNTVFYYNNELYLKTSSGIYRVAPRYNNEDYNALMNAFENDLEKE